MRALSAGRRWRGKIALEGDGRICVHRAWVAFDVAVLEKRRSRDVDVDDTAYGAGVTYVAVLEMRCCLNVSVGYAAYGAGVTVKGQIDAVVVRREKHRVRAGIAVVPVGLVMCELLHVGSFGAAAVLLSVLNSVDCLKP